MTFSQFVITERRHRGEAPYWMEPAAAQARLRLAAGRADAALAITDEPVAIRQTNGSGCGPPTSFPPGSRPFAATGRIRDAAKLVTAFARGLRGRDAPAPAAGLALCRAILASARGEHGRAATLFACAAAAWEALPRPYDALLARERQARSLIIIAGQAEAGLRTLSGVADGLHRLRAYGDLGRVTDTLKANGAGCGVARRPGRTGYGDKLSPRELDVVRLLVTGRTNRQIADVLVVSVQTVASHLHSAMRKLRVTSRTALAVSAVELGLVTGGQGHRPAGCRARVRTRKPADLRKPDLSII